MEIRREEEYSTSLRLTPEQEQALTRQADLLRISKSVLARLVILWARGSGDYTPYVVDVDEDQKKEDQRRSYPVCLCLTRSLNYYMNTVSVTHERTKGNMLMNMLEAWKAWHPYYAESVE